MTIPNAQTPPRADVEAVRRYKGRLTPRYAIPPEDRTEAPNARGLAAVDAEWVNAREAYDKEQAAGIDALLTARRKELAA